MTTQQNPMKMEHADFLVCQHVLEEFERPKHRKYVRSFKEPVDIVAVPNYLNVIRQPMDLSTLASKLERDIYDSAAAFKADFELMLNNSDLFNAGHPPSPVFEQGRQLREEFNQFWADQRNWLKKYHPHISSKPQLEVENKNEDMDEPPPKRVRQSSRLLATAESSPTTQSPYTAANLVRRSASNPVTSQAGPSNITSQASASLPGSSRADSASSPVKQSAGAQPAALVAAESLDPAQAEGEVSTMPVDMPEAASSSVIPPRTTNQPHNQGPIGSTKNPWEDFRESLRAMVTTEATAMLNDPSIKYPDDKSHFFANTLWSSIAADNNSVEEEEQGKSSFSGWVELAVEELSKVAIRDVGNQVQNETKRALIVMADRHHEYLRDKLDRSFENLRARLEVED